MVDPRANGHTDTVSILRVGSGPLFIVRVGSAAIGVVPEVLARMGEVCPQTDGEPLEGRFVGILHPVLDTGPLLPGLVYSQPSTKQLALQSMVGPANVLRHYEVLVSLHPRGATLGSEGVSVVADIDPMNPGVSLVRAGQAGSLRQG